ncbi:MAG: hypothetical protein WBE18_02735 [Gammaproteobacteria bacterium]
MSGPIPIDSIDSTANNIDLTNAKKILALIRGLKGYENQKQLDQFFQELFTAYNSFTSKEDTVNLNDFLKCFSNALQTAGVTQQDIDTLDQLRERIDLLPVSEVESEPVKDTNRQLMLDANLIEKEMDWTESGYKTKAGRLGFLTLLSLSMKYLSQECEWVEKAASDNKAPNSISIPETSATNQKQNYCESLHPELTESLKLIENEKNRLICKQIIGKSKYRTKKLAVLNTLTDQIISIENESLSAQEANDKISKALNTAKNNIGYSNVLQKIFDKIASFFKIGIFKDQTHKLLHNKLGFFAPPAEVTTHGATLDDVKRVAKTFK